LISSLLKWLNKYDTNAIANELLLQILNSLDINIKNIDKTILNVYLYHLIMHVIINNIYIKEDIFYIDTDKGIYNSNIIDGCINFKLFDENNNELYLSTLNIGEKVRLFCKNNIIKKIIIDTKYNINTDSSDIEDIDIIN